MVKSYKYVNKTITVKANPGVFVFEANSAEGKTYLGKILKKLNSAKIVRFKMIRELEDFNQDLIDEINSGTVEIVFFDRFDVYGSADMLLRFKDVFDKTIFLVDCKYTRKIGKVPYTMAYIELDKNSLEVCCGINF